LKTPATAGVFLWQEEDFNEMFEEVDLMVTEGNGKAIAELKFLN
jgi:hypothetical protein